MARGFRNPRAIETPPPPPPPRRAVDAVLIARTFTSSRHPPPSASSSAVVFDDETVDAYAFPPLAPRSRLRASPPRRTHPPTRRRRKSIVASVAVFSHVTVTRPRSDARGNFPFKNPPTRTLGRLNAYTSSVATGPPPASASASASASTSTPRTRRRKSGCPPAPPSSM
eukprot:31195-Pelagococcus_subviridis.AAC.11